MIKELWWLIKKLFSNIEDKKSTTYKKMKYFPFKSFSAMSWCSFLVTRRDKVNDLIVRHEDFHLKLEIANFLGKKHIRYYLSYFWEYLKGFSIFSNSAYYTNPYEMEAYANLSNPNYKVTKNSYKKYSIKHRNYTYKKVGKKNWKKYIEENF